MGLEIWTTWPTGSRRRSQEASTDAGGGRGDVSGVTSAHGGLW